MVSSPRESPLVFALATAVGLFACSSARSQWYDYGANVEIMIKSQYSSAMNMNLATARTIQRQRQNRTAKPEKLSRTEKGQRASLRKRTPSTTTLNFAADHAVTKRAQQHYLKYLANTDPDVAQKFETALRTHDVPVIFRRNSAAYGLDSHNVADVMSAYWVTLWAIANRHPIDDISKRTIQAVQRNVRAELAGNSYVRDMDPTTRQSVTELMMYDTILADASYDTAQEHKRSGMTSLLSNSVHDRVLKQGIDLRSMKLTDSGFHSR